MAKDVITVHEDKPTGISYQCELTESEISIIRIALDFFVEAIDNGDIELEMDEDSSYNLGYMTSNLVELFGEEND